MVLASIAPNGWTAADTGTPADYNEPGGLAPVSVSRQGFDATGAATTIAETLYTTKRVRLPYPNHNTLTANDVALSDYVYSTDTISGVTNSSAETSPKPVAAWAMPDRRVVGGTIDARIVSFHRNGLACAVFRATDGTNTVTATRAFPVASIDPLTGNAIVEYAATIDISTLNDNAAITLNAKVYPLVGGAGSVIDSADYSNQYDFSPRTFRRNTARAAAPPLVYVASGGNDTTGYVGTDPALAVASPCATQTGAINRARTVLGTGAGALDGLRVRLTAGTWSRSATPTANTVNAAIVIEPAPGVSKASCIFEFGAANNTFGLAHVRLTGLTVRRAGGFYLNNVAGTCTVDDCAWDWNGNTSTVIAAAATAQSHYFVNVAFTAATSGIGLAGGTAMAMALVRGCTGGAANSTASLEMLCWIGNAMLGGGLNNGSNRAQDNRVVAFNRFLSVGSSSVSSIVGLNTNASATGFAVVQNLFEYTAVGTAQRNFMPSGDGSPTSIVHLIVWQNTFAGFDGYGRGNILYDETAGTLGDATKRRTHKLQSFVGNIHVQINTKSDRFAGANSIADAPNRLGNWAYSHGVGVRGEFARYRDAGNGNFAAGIIPDYHGLGANIGTTNTGAGLDPLFTDPKHTTSGPTAGAGGGTYTLQAGSPAIDMVTNSPVAYDMAGTARAANDNAGAYAHGATGTSGTATGSLDLNGAGTATARVQASATGVVALAGGASAAVLAVAASTGVVPLSGAAVAGLSVAGASAGGMPFAGTGTGGVRVSAQSAGSVPLVGAASAGAVSPIAASASGDVSLAGAAVGASAVKAVAAGALNFTGAASGRVAVVAQASGSLPLVGAASAGAVTPISGQATGALAFVGATAASVPVGGHADAGLSLAGSSAASSAIKGAGTGGLLLSGSSATALALTGSGAGAFALTGAAVGVQIKPPPPPPSRTANTPRVSRTVYSRRAA